MVITEENNSKTESFLRAPDKIANLFNLPVQKIRASDPLIEFVGVKSKEKGVVILTSL